MQKEIIINYIDGYSLTLTLKDDEEIKSFTESLRKGKFYIEPESQQGFWTPANQIRYIQSRNINEPQVSGEDKLQSKDIQRAPKSNTSRKRTAAKVGK